MAISISTPTQEMSSPDGKDKSDWNRTAYLDIRLETENKLANDGKYQGRRLIRRDSQINQGVYLGKNAREAIVVDFEKDAPLRNLFEDARILACEYFADKSLSRQAHVLKAVYDIVVKHFKETTEEKLKDFLNRFDLKNDKKVSIGSFIKAKLGVCRHRALIVGVILEKFRERGYLSGHISVDRNTYTRGGHVWIRFVPTKNPSEIWILDASLEYFGRLDDKDKKDRRWDYYRPDDEK